MQLFSYVPVYQYVQANQSENGNHVNTVNKIAMQKVNRSYYSTATQLHSQTAHAATSALPPQTQAPPATHLELTLSIPLSCVAHR